MTRRSIEARRWTVAIGLAMAFGGVVGGCYGPPAVVVDPNAPPSTTVIVHKEGTSGQQGPAGPSGATGATGQSGASGASGTPGASGASGAPGQPGQTGSSGSSGQ
jgi:hypothetical protein